jgi:hypothetical protein
MHAADGVAQKVNADPPAADTYNTAAMAVCIGKIAGVFSTALEASTADLDIIPVDVKPALGTPT